MTFVFVASILPNFYLSLASPFFINRDSRLLQKQRTSIFLFHIQRDFMSVSFKTHKNTRDMQKMLYSILKILTHIQFIDLIQQQIKGYGEEVRKNVNILYERLAQKEIEKCDVKTIFQLALIFIIGISSISLRYCSVSC